MRLCGKRWGNAAVIDREAAAGYGSLPVIKTESPIKYKIFRIQLFQLNVLFQY